MGAGVAERRDRGKVDWRQVAEQAGHP